MKRLSICLLVFLAACKSNEKSETSELKSYSLDQLTGVWWNIQDSFVNGLQLDPNASLHFPNTYSATGIQWRLSNDTLFFLERGLRDTSLEESFFVIHDIRNDTLELKRLKEDNSFIRYTKRLNIDKTDSLLGRWMGVEGSFVDIIPKQDDYVVTLAYWDPVLQSMQYERHEAYASAAGISYKKNKVEHSIALTDGNGSGMKWLENAKLCIKITPGDGYCKY